jgi:hypothetical protein
MVQIKSLVELRKYIAQYIDSGDIGLRFNDGTENDKLHTKGDNILYWNNEPVITEEVVSEVPEVVVSDHFCVSCKFFNGSECVTVSLGLQNTANNCKYWKNKKETV